jgi:hypothetical protein
MLHQVKDYFLKEARAGLAVMVLVFLPLIAIAMFVFHHLPVVPPGAPLKIPPALINLLSKPLPAAINLPPASVDGVAGPTPSVVGPTPSVATPQPFENTVTVHVTRPVRPVSPRAVLSPGATPEPEASPESFDVIVHQVMPQPTPLVIQASAPPTSRLGMVVGTIPGVVALDVQIVRGQPLAYIDHWNVFPAAVARLPLSIDTEVNFKQAGLLLAVGDKVFVGVGGYAGIDLQPGWMAVAGMRF